MRKGVNFVTELENISFLKTSIKLKGFFIFNEFKTKQIQLLKVEPYVSYREKFFNFYITLHYVSVYHTFRQRQIMY